MALRYGVGLQHMGNLIGNMAQQSREERMLNEANAREDAYRQKVFGLQEDQFQEAQRAAGVREAALARGESRDIMKFLVDRHDPSMPATEELLQAAEAANMQGLFHRKEGALPEQQFAGPVTPEHQIPMTPGVTPGLYLAPSREDRQWQATHDLARQAQDALEGHREGTLDFSGRQLDETIAGRLGTQDIQRTGQGMTASQLPISAMQNRYTAMTSQLTALQGNLFKPRSNEMQGMQISQEDWNRNRSTELAEIARLKQEIAALGNTLDTALAGYQSQYSPSVYTNSPF